MLKTSTKANKVTCRLCAAPQSRSQGDAGRCTTAGVWEQRLNSVLSRDVSPSPEQGGGASLLGASGKVWAHQGRRRATLCSSRKPREKPLNRAGRPPPLLQAKPWWLLHQRLSGRHKGLLPKPKKASVLPRLAARRKGSFSSVGLVKFLALLGERKGTVPIKRQCPRLPCLPAAGAAALTRDRSWKQEVPSSLEFSGIFCKSKMTTTPPSQKQNK